MRFSGTFVIVAALFVTVLITSNIIVIKPVQILNLPFEILGSSTMVLTAAAAIFPVSYILGDILTEVYGYRIARGVIWLGFAANLMVVIFLVYAGAIPGEPSLWSTEDQAAYDRILGQVPGILVASFVAYLFGEFSNSTVLSLLKYSMRGRMLWVRTIGSTIVGQGLDSFIFIFLAFGLFGDWSVNALITTSLGQWVFKVSYETLATPLTYAVVNFMKRRGADGRNRRAPLSEPTGYFRLILSVQIRQSWQPSPLPPAPDGGVQPWISCRSRSSCSASSGVTASPKSSISYKGRISISLGPGMGFGQRLTHSRASAKSCTSHSQNPATSSEVWAKGPSITVRLSPSKATRLPSEDGFRPSPLCIIPALTSSSLKLNIASTNSVEGMTPASLSTVAFTITITRISIFLRQPSG